MNTKNGYWVGSLDGIGIPHGISHVIPLENHARYLSFSDGYARLFDTYKLMNYSDIQFDVESIQKSIQLIREYEGKNEDIPESSSYYKRRDDVSVILIENK